MTDDGTFDDYQHGVFSKFEHGGDSYEVRGMAVPGESKWRLGLFKNKDRQYEFDKELLDTAITDHKTDHGDDLRYVKAEEMKSKVIK